MAETDAARMPKLVPLTEAVSTAEMRDSLAASVDAGDILFYVRVPAGKAVFIDGIRPVPTGTDAFSAWNRSLSPYDQAQARDAARAGIPVIRYPKIIPNVTFLGLATKDARLLMGLGRTDVHWFPYAVQFSPQSATDPRPLARLAPWKSPCCLRSDDGKPKRGPWIDHDKEHTLTIHVRDVFVEPEALERALSPKDDPFGLKNTAPGVHVLCRAAAHFNRPDTGVDEPSVVVQGWVQSRAKECGIDHRLFNGEVLKQVRKLINTQHRELQGVRNPIELDVSVLNDEEAIALDHLGWASKRLMMVVHAARYWQQLIKREQRPWEAIDLDKQMLLTLNLEKTLEGWGFTATGERHAIVSLALYPVNRPAIRASQKRKRPSQPTNRSQGGGEPRA